MVVLGSTGSIGVNVLAVARQFNIEIEVLVAGTNTARLNQQIEEFKPKKVVVKDERAAKEVCFPAVSYGEKSILEAIETSQSEVVVNALEGVYGVLPTLKAQSCQKRIALANKESLVVAGHLIKRENITPIDSEHFAAWYLLNGRAVSKMVLTASGGALRDYPLEKISKASVKEVLNHPNWSMGKKITVDSATMANKLFELLEAYWMFGVKNLDAIIETKSLIHAFVEYKDGSTTAHLSKADMKLPIAYALLGKVDTPILEPVDLFSIESLSFEKIDTKRYPLWELKEELLQNPTTGAAFNFANDIAVELFLKGQISYGEISKMVMETYKKYQKYTIISENDIYDLKNEIKGELCNTR